MELKNFMASHIPEIKVFDLEGTYLQWMDFSGLRLDGDVLESMLHNEAEVFFDDGRIFGEVGYGFERMNIACPTSIMMDALIRLEAAVRRIKPAPEVAASLAFMLSREQLVSFRKPNLPEPTLWRISRGLITRL